MSELTSPLGTQGGDTEGGGTHASDELLAELADDFFRRPWVRPCGA